MSAKSTFIAKAPGIMDKLMADFLIGRDDAAAIVGNLGHECAGFTLLQEQKPVVKGSKGGYGWAQWTGPRRRDYTAYCSRNNLDMASDKANYGFLFVELMGTEKKAIPAVKAAGTLNEKVVAFEKAFLRAGVKHYPSRQQYAAWAVEAWQAALQKPASKPASAQKPVPAPEQPAKPKPAPAPAAEAKPGLLAAILAALATAVALGWGLVADLPCNLLGVLC